MGKGSLRMKKLPTVAICYDFDMTLSPKNMQEFGFFEALETNADKFWGDQNQFIEMNIADRMLANMYGMVVKAKEKNIKLTKQSLKDFGKSVEFFDGVETWFGRINKYGEEIGVNVEHFVVSSGIKEMIEGTSIAKYFKKIYACSFLYDNNGEAIWPALSVNYTNKTQFLHRINRGRLSEIDDSINDVLTGEEKSVPFENMIYIGDSDTDIPCMRLVMKNGGKVIGVYRDVASKKAHLIELLKNNKINYVAKADYSEGKVLETIIKQIIKSNKINFNLKEISKQQKIYF